MCYSILRVTATPFFGRTPEIPYEQFEDSHEMFQNLPFKSSHFLAHSSCRVKIFTHNSNVKCFQNSITLRYHSKYFSIYVLISNTSLWPEVTVI